MFYVRSVEHILDIDYIYTYVIVFVIYVVSYTCISDYYYSHISIYFGKLSQQSITLGFKDVVSIVC